MAATTKQVASGVQAVAAVLCLFAVAPGGEAQELPPAEGLLRSEQPELLRVGAIAISDISVEGVTVFSAEEVEAMVAPYRNRTVTIEDLQALRHAVSAAYLDQGYVNSGVLLPDQQVENGRVVLQAIEGRLTELEIDGIDRVSQRSVERKIEYYVGAPLDISRLQEGLRVLQQDPLVDRVNAELLPGSGPGEGLLRLGIAERPAWEVQLGASNHRSPSVGEDRGTVGFVYRGLIGNGDELAATLGVTEGVDDNSIAYGVPVGPAGTRIDFYYAEQDSDIVEEPFAEIDIASRLESWGVTASRPFIREGNRSLVGIVGFEHKRSESRLLGMPFSFSPGDVDGRARGSTVSLGVEWSRQLGSAGWAARGVAQVGVDALDATRFDDTGNPGDWPDTTSVALIGQVQYVRQVRWRGSRWMARTSFQLAQDPLLAMYKLPVGGRYSVRGYRENQFVRDNGAVTTVEYQFPLTTDDTGRPRRSLQLAVFADYGVAWDENAALPTSSKARIASAGLGLLWDPIPALHAEVYWGHDFDEQSGPADSLQGRGLHYQLAFQKLF